VNKPRTADSSRQGSMTPNNALEPLRRRTTLLCDSDFAKAGKEADLP
jgi:hypothetical protein